MLLFAFMYSILHQASVSCWSERPSSFYYGDESLKGESDSPLHPKFKHSSSFAAQINSEELKLQLRHACV